MATLAEQYTEVKDWLQELFRDEDDVPPFDNNAATIQALYSLCRESKKTDAMAEAATTDATKRAQEYRLGSAQLTSLLDSVGVSENALTPTGREALDALVETQLQLQTRDNDGYTIMAGVSHHEGQRHAARHAHARAAERLQRTQTACAQAQRRLNATTKVCDDLSRGKTAAAVDARWREADVQQQLEAVADTKRSLTHREAHLERLGFSSDIMHNNLQQLQQATAAIQRECDALEQQLQAVQPLPKDVREARVYLERARLRRQQLVDKLKANFDHM
ncbi:hypothetical protein PTSG_09762 [Salpingoeca rosetta]|uniref:Uncharacterized protein n=1 Tax=Salpingoeca rosetta (strain ATCC 50818 / BSB-021) TaxID=946362 RepID=F2UNZ3_SALR5|nr:uncharacterized protein PTSG_09762 [Salpingoeca rosetta]EGD79348.1 hypothetical protein PTSG_09762 [Salpingoeca rosetta]|eukprot:XP_004989117.1 hypothetical protein PTSG_09762 [Salpingoeca rosetta]